MLILKVYLLTDVLRLGKKGDIIEVSDGYANNFLIPKKLAAAVTDEILAQKKSQDEAKEYHAQQELKKIKEKVKFLNGKEVVVRAKEGVNGKLFGTITSKDVAESIRNELGVEIDKKKLVLPEIKSFGTFDFKIKFDGNNVAVMKLIVKAS